MERPLARPGHRRNRRPSRGCDDLRRRGELKFAVDVVEQLGNETILYGHLPDGQSMTVRLSGQARFTAGDQIALDLAADRVIPFDGEGKNLRKSGGR